MLSKYDIDVIDMYLDEINNDIIGSLTKDNISEIFWAEEMLEDIREKVQVNNKLCNNEISKLYSFINRLNFDNKNDILKNLDILKDSSCF